LGTFVWVPSRVENLKIFFSLEYIFWSAGCLAYARTQFQCGYETRKSAKKHGRNVIDMVAMAGDESVCDTFGSNGRDPLRSLAGGERASSRTKPLSGRSPYLQRERHKNDISIPLSGQSTAALQF
jgi:hypothetical protein